MPARAKRAISALLLFTALDAAAQGGWTVTRLPDSGNASAAAINNLGQVVGAAWYQDIDARRAVLWDAGRMSYLDPTSNRSAASDINAAGQAVGTSFGAGIGEDFGQWRATRWQDGRALELAGPAGEGYTGASAINRSGTVVGFMGLGISFLPMVWTGAHAVALPLPVGYASGDAADINASGQILFGAYEPPSAFVGSGTSFQDIGHLFPAVPWTFASAINDAGQVVGSSFDLSTGTSHAFVWKDGRMRDLGTPAGFSDARAVAINASGQVLGFASGIDPQTGVPQEHAVLWDGDRIVDLTVAVGAGAQGRSLRLSDINDSGVIVGSAVDRGNYQRSFAIVLTPVPEPGTATLLVAGGALVWGLRRRASRLSATSPPSA